ncbi:DUF6186 family protein [Amycolatopsis jiangsuensis]|uniref:Uncharacterized protein n=1 Tax=Amycolatopsis jiangsuensis TaxID=1181879 RepID=A0A840IR03_9PSEU|nr:DUF6186 family protein [Amycolatopsis jiangsuensis]MBB4683464.1 hypothetical protein [Amycolatopsis jiangsuensis]
MTSRLVTEIGFGTIVVAAISLWVASHVAPKKVPPLTRVLSALMRKRSTRVALVLAWWWVGWHFFVQS